MKLQPLRRSTNVRCLSLLGVALLAFASAPALAQASAPEDRLLHVLFIGNSFTFRNNLPEVLAALSRMAGSPRRIETAQVTVPGATLDELLGDSGSRAVQAIRNGKWDYVVLQEQSHRPLLRPGQMRDAALKFDAEVRKAGAKTALFLTWPDKDSPSNEAGLEAAYEKLGEDLGALVVPVGPAWARAEQLESGINLYATDFKHPSPLGTYLAACTFLLTFERAATSCPEVSIPFVSAAAINVARRAGFEVTSKIP